MTRYYSIPQNFFLLYRELIGLEQIKKDDDKAPKEDDQIENNITFRSFEELREQICENSEFGYDTFSVLPPSSVLIADGLDQIIERACNNFGDYEEEEKIKKMMYIGSAIGILYGITQINVLPKDNNNYMTHFNRVNELILLGFSIIDAYEPEDLYKVYEWLETSSPKIILGALDHYKGNTRLGLSIYLLSKLNGESDLDYYVFNENGKVDLKKTLEAISYILKKDVKSENENNSQTSIYDNPNNSLCNRISKLMPRFSKEEIPAIKCKAKTPMRMSIKQSYSLEK